MLSTPYKVVYSDHQIELCEYRKGDRGGITLIVPPQAGHTSLGIVDYGEGRSLVKCALDNNAAYHGVYVINSKGCTDLRKNETYDDMTEQVIRACIKANASSGDPDGNIHLVGLCQGGVLATVVCALAPKLFSKLSIAGAPIDCEAAESDLTAAIAKPMATYRMMVAWGIEPFKRGMMSGQDMLMAWKSMNPVSHYIDRYVNLFMGDCSREKLYEWYDNTQDIAGPAYLFMIEEIFKNNKLIKGELEVFGRKVALSAITCEVVMVTGQQDTITPAPQTYALEDVLPVHTKKTWVSVEGGHLAVFNGRNGIKTVWPEVFA